MKKSKVKLLLTIICFLLINALFFNYIVFDTLNLSTLNKLSFLYDKDNYQTLEYDREFILENQQNSSIEPNAAGTSVHKYYLEIEEVPEEIKIIKLELDEEKANASNKVIQVYSGDKVQSYNGDDIYIDTDSENIIIIEQENVDKIVIESSFEQYGVSSLVNPEVLSIESISFNNEDDFDILENSLLLDLLKSILITVIVYLFYLVLFKTKVDKVLFKKGLKLEKVFLILSILGGITFSVLFPLYQIPDELSHINMIYAELNLDMKFNDIAGSYGDTNRIIRNYDEKVDLEKYFDLDNHLEITDEFEVPTLKVVRHFPQTIGLVVSSLLELPVFVGITIAEVFAVLFYSIVCYVALKLLPLKKEAMMLIMLLPMCFQQMGSFSYDAVLLPLCFLFISYVLHLKFTKEKIKIFDVLVMLGLLILIALIKLPYAMLGGMVLLLPVSKVSLKIGKFKLDGNWLIKNKKIIFIILGLLFIPVCFILFKVLNGMCYGRILIAAIKANLSTVHLLANTVSIHWKEYFSGLTGDFGWLDTPVSPIFTIFIMFSLIFVSFFNVTKNNDEIKFKKWESLYLLILGCCFCVIIILSMFEWTLYATGVPNYKTLSILEYETLIRNSIPAIGGVQGRYFIPIIPLFILPLFSNIINKINNKMNCKFYLFLYYVIVLVYMLFIILNRYWIG